MTRTTKVLMAWPCSRRRAVASPVTAGGPAPELASFDTLRDFAHCPHHPRRPDGAAFSGNVVIVNGAGASAQALRGLKVSLARSPGVAPMIAPDSAPGTSPNPGLFNRPVPPIASPGKCTIAAVKAPMAALLRQRACQIPPKVCCKCPQSKTSNGRNARSSVRTLGQKTERESPRLRRRWCRWQSCGGSPLGAPEFRTG